VATRDFRSKRGSRTDPSSAEGMKGIIEHIFKRENEEQEIIAGYAPVIETYIQVEKPDPLMGTVPTKDYYSLGLADFRGKDMKVHSMTERRPEGLLVWSFEPSGFFRWSLWIGADSTMTTTGFPT
jgi:hypothetical protein